MFNSLNPILIIMGIFLLFYSFSFFFLPVILLLLVVGINTLSGVVARRLTKA